MELFPDLTIKESERLYVIGNGFDIHHGIESKYQNFKRWVQKNGNSNLVGMMDIFFSNDCDFWADIENAFGDYREAGITSYCEPENPDDFKFDRPTQWQAGIEDGIPYIFGDVMARFREVFDEWVNSIDIRGIEADLRLPKNSKYLTFNYTETLETCYYIPGKNIQHIHGSRIAVGDEFVLGHGNYRDENEPYSDDGLLLPYQNAYREVIKIMNERTKKPDIIISNHKDFFESLRECKGVCVIGMSYNDIDMPYFEKIAASVARDCKWWLHYYSRKDMVKAEAMAQSLALNDYCLRLFV